MTLVALRRRAVLAQSSTPLQPRSRGWLLRCIQVPVTIWSNRVALCIALDAEGGAHAMRKRR